MNLNAPRTEAVIRKCGEIRNHELYALVRELEDENGRIKAQTLTEFCDLPSNAFGKHIDAQKEAGGPEDYAMQPLNNDTPQTDANAGYAVTCDGVLKSEHLFIDEKNIGPFVHISFARKLEKDNARLTNELRFWQSELSKVMPPDFKDWWQNSPREWPIVARRCIENLRNRLNLAHNEEDTLINRISQLEKDLENRPTQEEYERVCTSNHALERELAELRHTIRLDAIDKIPKMSL